jgi:hypothetical protein
MTGRATVFVGLFSIRPAKASGDSQDEITPERKLAAAFSQEGADGMKPGAPSSCRAALKT